MSRNKSLLVNGHFQEVTQNRTGENEQLSEISIIAFWGPDKTSTEWPSELVSRIRRGIEMAPWFLLGHISLAICYWHLQTSLVLHWQLCFRKKKAMAPLALELNTSASQSPQSLISYWKMLLLVLNIICSIIPSAQHSRFLRPSCSHQSWRMLGQQSLHKWMNHSVTMRQNSEHPF